MDSQIVYIVTRYGCNSTPSDMWIPTSKLFTNYDEAYAHFLEVSPSLDDKWNKAEQFTSTRYKENTTEDYIVIENRVQIAGYCYGKVECAKRPEGAVIAKSIIKK